MTSYTTVKGSNLIHLPTYLFHLPNSPAHPPTSSLHQVEMTSYTTGKGSNLKRFAQFTTRAKVRERVGGWVGG